MKREILGLLTGRKALEYTVKSDWPRIAPIKRLMKFASAFWKPELVESDGFKFADVHIEEAVDYVDYTEVIEPPIELPPVEPPVARHIPCVDSRPILHWMFSYGGGGAQLPLNFRVRQYHSSSFAHQRWEQGIVIDGEDGIDDPTDQEEPAVLDSSDFRELRLCDYYVDRSEFVRAFENGGYEVGVITLPRKFQKSANLSTVKYFYEIEVDERGEPLPLEERQNTALFAGGEVNVEGEARFLEPLRVAAYPDIMRMQGALPVVSADFQEVSGESYEEALSSIKGVLHNTWNQHSYLLNSTKLRTNQQALVERYVDPIGYEDLTHSQIEYGLQTLTELLHQHFGVPAIILIDNYGTTINAAYVNSETDPRDANKIARLYRYMFGDALKGNNSLYKGLVTGILPIVNFDGFSGFNNAGEFRIEDDAFAGYYGFTQEEVDDLMARFNVPLELVDGIKDWYGYSVLGKSVYNPLSIVHAVSKFRACRNIDDMAVVQQKVLQNFWQESGNFDFILPLFNHPSIERIFRELSEGREVCLGLNRQISDSDFIELREVLNYSPSYEITQYGIRVLFSYLYAVGYLTPGGRDGYYRAPNKEARDEFAQRLVEHYEEMYAIAGDFTNQIRLVFNAEDAEYEVAVSGIEKAVQKVLNGSPTFAKLGSDKIESEPEVDLIPGIVSHASMKLLSATRFCTEVYVSNDRTSCLIIDDKSRKAIIFELKYDKGDADGTAVQIDKRGYAKPIPEGYTVVNIGLNVDHDKIVSSEYEVDRGISEVIDLVGDTADLNGELSEVGVVGDDQDPTDSTH